MGLFKAVNRYLRKVESRFTKQIGRIQFNHPCDKVVVLAVKIMSKQLGAPLYVIAEHCLQLGLSEMAAIVDDVALRERLCRHLVEDHLLIPAVKPESEPISRRALRLKNAIRLLELLEIKSSPEAQREVILRLIKEVDADSSHGRQASVIG